VIRCIDKGPWAQKRSEKGCITTPEWLGFCVRLPLSNRTHATAFCYPDRTGFSCLDP